MKLKHNVYRQLITIVLITFAIIYISVAVILPKTLTPIYEKNIYFNLQAPLNVVQKNSTIDDNIAYIFVKDSIVTSSGNLTDIINIPAYQILENITDEHGKFRIHRKTYYYNTKTDENGYYKVAITNDNYIKQMKKDILTPLLPILLITLLVILLMVAVWSQILADRIKKLKEKVDNLDNDDYVSSKSLYKVDDEIEDLSLAIDKMKLTLQKQEDYKNQMYQNISHDFKTPLTVIKSYVEAIEDGVQEEKEGLMVIKEETKKLEIKVHSLLYLNKLTYMKDTDNYKRETLNVVDILVKSVEKFKVTRPDVKWTVNITDKKTIFNGSDDMWEAIIDNILSNFTRYAEKEIKITVKGHQIIFYNDGPNIDESILTDIFTPYKKGIEGQFGLGLSIVKKTVSLLGYEISVKNEKTGISFTIK